MATKKKPVSRKKRKSSKSSRTQARAGSFRRFINALTVSAIVSFTAASCALNPQFHDSGALEPVLEHLGLDRLGLERFTAAQPPVVPAATATDGYVQTAFAHCPQFFPNRQPPIVPAGKALRELCFEPFATLHSGQTKTPVFIAQRLNRQMLVKAQRVQRKDRFYEEARLPQAERARLIDYRGSGFDRGHMAPAGDMHNDEAMAQSFSLANMVPQDAQHNRGAWAKVEADTRKYVLRAKGDVYIFTGPVYGGTVKTIGEGRVAVPNYLYKAVYDATTGRSWVHWHVNSADIEAALPIDYEEFVRRTGLHLLPSAQ